MFRVLALVVILCVHQTYSVLRLGKVVPTEVQDHTYDTKYFPVKLSHFSFGEKRTFNLRYLINTDSWKPGQPIFFYTGNEGDIKNFADNTGFMWEIAPSYQAMVVFAEHRFYGLSMPCGNDSLTKIDCYGYLTSEEALADYVELIYYLKSTISGAEKSAVIAFGGSYGGMLSAWMRIKYPNVISGAIAASAPIWQFTNLTSCDAFSSTTTNAYAKSGSQDCVNSIRQIWQALTDAVKTSDGQKQVEQIFQLCNPLPKGDASSFKAYLNDLIVSAAMGNYPYPATFLGKWPAWPVKAFCGALVNSTDKSNPREQVGAAPLFKAMANAIFALSNYSGDLKCLDINATTGTVISADAWPIQVCTEMVMPMCSNGVTDMFEPSPWSLSNFTSDCQTQFNVNPDAYWIEKVYWGKKLSAASNILFSNGQLDPWSSGGVLTPLSAKLPVVIIPSGAHHVDLRSSNPADPEDITMAREVEKYYISMWVEENNSQ